MNPQSFDFKDLRSLGIKTLKAKRKTTRSRWENYQLASQRLFKKNVFPDGTPMNENQIIARDFLAALKNKQSLRLSAFEEFLNSSGTKTQT